MNAILIRTITPMLYRYRGSYRNLQKALETMEPLALRELLQLLRNVEDEIRQAKRTVRLFPGGPKVKL